MARPPCDLSCQTNPGGSPASTQNYRHVASLSDTDGISGKAAIDVSCVAHSERTRSRRRKSGRAHGLLLLGSPTELNYPCVAPCRGAQTRLRQSRDCLTMFDPRQSNSCTV